MEIDVTYGILIVNNNTQQLSVKEITRYETNEDDNKINVFQKYEKDNNCKIIDRCIKSQRDGNGENILSEKQYGAKTTEWMKRMARYLLRPANRFGFQVSDDNPDDITLYQYGDPILKISLPEMSTQWNTKLP